jgi:hypothetical protein
VVRKIVSGGQTGADRGALDAAIDLGLEHGGYCPAGRRAEDGRVPDRYRLIETASADHAERTERNVLASDGTLLVTRGPATGGSALTALLAARHRRPLLHLDLDRNGADGSSPAAQVDAIREWLATWDIEVLNVAGPRASGCREIAQDVRALLRRVLARRSRGG